MVRVQKLLGGNVGVDSRDHEGSTALMVASWHGNAEAVGKLLAAGAAVELKGPDGESALHLAAWGGNVRCVELLLRAGASCDSQACDTPRVLPLSFLALFQDTGHMTPLMFAAWNGR